MNKFRTVVDLFETQVSRSPDSIAVIDDRNLLTYLELNRRANQIAHSLRRFGVGPEVLVGICLERSVELVVGLLAILKSGGAYVPIDSSFPSERISQIISDSSPAAILTQKKFLGKVREYHERVLCIETLVQEVENVEDRCSTLTPQNLAYVIYTSGSTGKPKGVEIMHSSLVALASAVVEEWGITPKERFLASTTVAFDMSVSEIFTPLATGASLKIADSPFINRDTFLCALNDPEITFVHGTTSAWRMILDCGWQGNRKLRAVCGGEALPLELARELTNKVGVLWNMYGPTEACVWSTISLIRPDDSIVTLGHSLAGTQIYVLDPDGKLVPPGSQGELCIAGTGLARGYRGDSDLTSRKFVPNPFCDSAGGRLFRTGDLVQVHQNLGIQFIGRMDHQLKVRGFRIEPGDVEEALRRHDSIRDAAVTAREDATGSNLLMAYLVAKAGCSASVQELRMHLSKILPPFMIPSVFMFLESLPVTANGKLDRNALLRLDGASAKQEGDYTPPSNWIEQTLARIWSDVLAVDLPGSTDNFFDLGGHSLSAAQVLARIRKEFNTEIPFAALFQAPTISHLSQHVARAISAARHSLPAIKKMDRQPDVPLSFPQEGVWFLQQLNPECRAYHFQSKIQFDGDLDPELLRRSLAEIIGRHEIYRTSFPSIMGRPVQRIHDPWVPELPVVDLSGDPDPESAAEKFIHRTICETKFDLQRLPLIHWILLHISDKRNVLLHVEHHMVHDGWSFRLFLQELVTLYSAYSKDLASPLPELDVQFADYAWWQHHVNRNFLKTEHLPYWKDKLTNAQQVTELPSDYSRPKQQSYRGAAPRMDLPPALYESLLRLAKENSTTLFVTMLSALQALIYRYTGQVDLVLGTSIANRRERETERLIGMIINTVVLRTDLSGNPTFRQLLDRSHQTMLEAQEHQDVPFRAIVETLQPERQLQANPIFQVMLNFHDVPFHLPEIPGLEITVTEVISNDTAKFDLNLIVIPPVKKIKGREAITLIWEYSTDVFEAATIQRMMNHYVRILEGAVADPDCKISDLPVLTQAEQQHILVDWNKTTTRYPREKSISELFEQQVEQNPEALAVRDAAKSLTYGELNDKANQLARYLQHFGVGAEATVGIAMGRSVEMVVGLLAILKSGGAYVPLDVTDPSRRISTILEDAEPGVIITMKVSEEIFAEHSQKMIRIDADWNKIAEERCENLSLVCNGENLAYVMYTSGTTGKPKGVAVVHRGVTRLVHNLSYIPLSKADIFLQTAPVCFDVSAFEIWGALLNGAQLVLPKEHLSLEELGQTIRDYQVTTLWLASALFSKMVAHNIYGLKTVKTLITGGDVVSRSAAQEARRQLQDTRIFNGYGPTEATMFSSFFEIRETTRFEKNIPIGRPAQNTQMYILDEWMHPVPVGVKSDIYIGGDGLARGYYKDPVLTEAKFVVAPFAVRLYKTGDAGRWLPDGNIDFLGRQDDQFKIRGFRIDPEEIEAALMELRAVKEAAVVPVESSSGDRRLAAYIVLHNRESLTIYDLRTFLSQTLPAYMVPAVYVFLDALPLTTSGKIDRKALPPPDWEPELSRPYLQPQTRVEEIIAKIWGKILDRDRIGVMDDFFELGGDSLAAIRVVSHVHDALGVQIPLRLIFEKPTVSGLSKSIQNRAEGALLSNY